LIKYKVYYKNHDSSLDIFEFCFAVLYVRQVWVEYYVVFAITKSELASVSSEACDHSQTQPHLTMQIFFRNYCPYYEKKKKNENLLDTISIV
jgi:hypothetical protein